MRHLEALAIAAVTALSVTMLASFSLRQAVPIHHVGAQRALAWAIICSSNPYEVAALALNAMEGRVAGVWINGKPFAEFSSARFSICYSAALVNGTEGSVTLVRVCARP